MEEATREQQREARRQKVLARSQGDHRATVADLATSQNEMAPEGASAELDQDPSSLRGDNDNATAAAAAAAAVPEDSNKSASRLAAERRRQRILSKSSERMAKVQGDRVIHGAGRVGAGEGGGDAVGGGGGESLDDMLDAAEVEFFGEAGVGSVAEAKPAAPQQAYFKSSKGSAAAGGGGASAGGSGAAAAAQSKPARERRAAGGGFKPSKPDANARKDLPASSGRRANRRPTGNKALDKQPFDLASIQSMAFAASGNFGKGAGGANSGGNASPAGVGSGGSGGGRGRGRGVRFWATVEGVTKTALLLLAGAGVGGLLFPEASVAMAQTKFAVEHARARDSADMMDRLREELNIGDDLSSSGKGPKSLYVNFEGDEFGDSTPNAPPPSANKVEENSDSQSGEGGATKEAGSGRGGGGAGGGGGHDTVKMEGWPDLAAGFDDVPPPSVLGWLLSYMDYVVEWSHSLSTMVVPSWVGEGGRTACVPAIVLAVLVRLVVSSLFSILRVGLGLPAFPSAVGKSKPGMVMGMVLAAMPMLGKALAFGRMIKNVFADTTLVVAGTVLTLTVCLGCEEDSGPRTAARNLLGMVGMLRTGGHDLKEL